MLQGRRFGFPDRIKRSNFLIYLIFPAVLGPGIYLAPDRNECHKQKNKTFLGSGKRSVFRAVKFTDISEPTV
jgi:hypothetical protein